MRNDKETNELITAMAERIYKEHKEHLTNLLLLDVVKMLADPSAVNKLSNRGGAVAFQIVVAASLGAFAAFLDHGLGIMNKCGDTKGKEQLVKGLGYNLQYSLNKVCPEVKTLAVGKLKFFLDEMEDTDV